jgi:bacterial peptide chain release factor 3 (bRF-3)
MRDTPVIIFINKMDRDGRNPFDLLEEVEKKLSIKTQPLSWPINMGRDFKGVYNLFNNSLLTFQANQKATDDDLVFLPDLSTDDIVGLVGKKDAEKLREDIELISTVYESFDKNAYLQGKLAPVFFGSAVNNFGIKDLLDTFIEIAPSPKPRMTDVREVVAEEDKFTGFIFKIHANIDPRHRDRIAFLRICSGRFERNTFYLHVRSDKKMRFSNPYTFLAREKNVVEDAYPGDVVGLFDTGNFKIGDTLTEGEKLMYQGIPSFSPEIFKELVNNDPMKSKQLEKGINQLTDEGVAQLFTQHGGNRKIIGCVGDLQFEVIQHRLLHEYGAACSFRVLPFYKACWIKGDKETVASFIRFKQSNIVEDKEGNLVYLAESEWYLNTERRNNPGIQFYITNDYLHELV